MSIAGETIYFQSSLSSISVLQTSEQLAEEIVDLVVLDPADDDDEVIFRVAVDDVGAVAGVDYYASWSV